MGDFKRWAKKNMTPFIAINLAIIIIYSVASIFSAVASEYSGYKRYIPLLPVIAALINLIIGQIHLHPGMRFFIMCFSGFLIPVFLFYALRITWTGKRWFDRTLRVTSAILFGEIVYFVLNAHV